MEKDIKVIIDEYHYDKEITHSISDFLNYWIAWRVFQIINNQGEITEERIKQMGKQIDWECELHPSEAQEELWESFIKEIRRTTDVWHIDEHISTGLYNHIVRNLKISFE